MPTAPSSGDGGTASTVREQEAHSPASRSGPRGPEGQVRVGKETSRGARLMIGWAQHQGGSPPAQAGRPGTRLLRQRVRARVLGHVDKNDNVWRHVAKRNSGKKMGKINRQPSNRSIRPHRNFARSDRQPFQWYTQARHSRHADTEYRRQDCRRIWQHNPNGVQLATSW